ncbi:MAG: hypothetical protein V3S52_03785 [Gemmatimonadota bacterium]
MNRLLRRSALGAMLGGLLFAGLAAYMNRATGTAPLDDLGPLAFTAALGATIGGLVAPLFRRR